MEKLYFVSIKTKDTMLMYGGYAKQSMAKRVCRNAKRIFHLKKMIFDTKEREYTIL